LFVLGLYTILDQGEGSLCLEKEEKAEEGRRGVNIFNFIYILHNFLEKVGKIGLRRLRGK
jgi:hypothetical protein